MAEKVVLAEFEFDTTGIKSAQEENARLKAEIISLREEQKQTNKAIKDGSITLEEGAKTLSKNDAELKNLNKSYQSNTKLINANAASTSSLNSALNEEIKTEQQALNNIQKLTQARKGLDATTAEGRKQIDLINKKIDQNNEFVTQNSDAYTKQKRNVGNYTDSIRDALSSQDLFNGSLNGFGSAISALNPVFSKLREDLQGAVGEIRAASIGTDGLSKSQKASAIATNASSGALKLLRVALISTGVGALVVAFGSLITFLTSTQRGIDAVTTVTRPLQAIFQSLVGVLQDVGENLFDAFTNPKQALEDLGEFLKQNLINRFKAFGEILEGIINLDFKQVADGILQVGTGVEDLTSKIAGAAENTSKFLSEAAAKGAEIDRLTKEKEKLETNIASRNAELTSELEKQRVILSDTARSGEERSAAAGKAEELQQSIIDNENEILQLEIDRLVIKQSLNDTTREENKELDELIAKQIANEDKLEKQRKQNIAARKKLQDEAAQAEASRQAQRILSSKEALALFQAENDALEKNAKEQLDFELEVSKKRIEILEQEFEAGKISKTKFETEKIKIENEFQDVRLELLSESITKELDIYVQANETRIQEGQRLTEQILTQEEDRLNQIAQKQRTAAQQRLENGIIDQETFNEQIAAINENNRIAQEEKRLELKAQREEEKAIDFELEIERLLLEGESRAEIEKQRLDNEAKQRIKTESLTAEQIEQINENLAKKKTLIDQTTNRAKVDLAGQAFGDIAGFFSEETAIAKLAGAAQASINIEQGITKALASKGFAGIVEGSLIAARGAISLATIAGVPDAFADGGIVGLSDGRITTPSNIPTRSNGDDVLATVKRGEVILNQGQQAALGGAATFRAIGVPGFASGGLVPSSVQNEIASSTISREEAINLARAVVMNTRVINVARDTIDLAGDEIQVEQSAVI